MAVLESSSSELSSTSTTTTTTTSNKPIKNWGGYDHIVIWCSNAKQSAEWYMLRFGFEYCCYKGLETGNRNTAEHVIKLNNIYLVLVSPYNPVETEYSQRIGIKGDAVKDVAFTVKDCDTVYKQAIGRGAVSVQPPTKLQDEHGYVVLASIATYGDVIHTLVERHCYSGSFLPGYKRVTTKQDPLSKLLPSGELLFIDHIVGNQPDNKMEEACKYYEVILGFHRFWSVDDTQIHSDYSSLRSIVMSDPDSDAIKMPINEPANGKRKSQIQEYIDYNGSAGVQHIALRTNNIIDTIKLLRQRGVEFLTVPYTYYDDLKYRLTKSPVQVYEDIDTLAKLHILVDFDDKGYLLQIFTKPVQDRPTLFYEVIQRCNHSGFGAGNFLALFQAIERDQIARGN